MHIQPVTGINAEQRKLEILKDKQVTGTSERFNQRGTGLPEAIAEKVSAVSNDIVGKIDTEDTTQVIQYPPKITIVNTTFVISDHANGLVYNYQVISIDGAWNISLSSIVG